MADISMCKDKGCPIKETCWRFKAPANEHRQSYGSFKYGECDVNGNGCDYYWEMDK